MSIDARAAALPQNAVAATLARLRRRFVRTATFMLALCLSIALLLTAWDGGHFGYKLVYSAAVTVCCWWLTDLTRLASAWLSDRLRRARGLPDSPSGFGSGWRGIVPAALMAALLGPMLGLSIGDRLTGLSSPSLLSLSAGSTRMTFALTLVASLTSIFVLGMMEQLSAARAQAEAAQRLAAENQLRLLRSQLEPHMLFNTLANLRVLIALDPPRAQAMLDRMIAFLRGTLGASRADTQPLSAEFAHLADYLALMAVRMGERLQVQIELPDALAALPVPPLLLQPLVENAVRHGLEPKVEGGRIEMRAALDGAALRLTVRDTGVGLAENKSGFGTTQVRERLATLYGGNASLTLESAGDAEGGTLATVKLPLPEKR